MKNGENGSDKPPKDNETSDDPKFEKRTSIMLKEIEKKEKDGEIDAKELDLLKRTLENTTFLKSKEVKDPGKMIAERVSDPKFEKRTSIMLKEIEKKEKDGEIDAKELDLLKNSL